MAYTSGVFYIDLVSGSDAARTALTGCIASNPSGTITRINKTAHGLVTGAVVDLTLFSTWLNSAWKITKVDNDNFDLDGAIWQTTADNNGTVTPRGGSSWADAWLTTLNGATAARIQSGDEVRVAKTPDPVSIGNATWTNASRTVTLATAQTLLVDNCETAWTAANAATVAVSVASPKEGTGTIRVIKTTTPAANTLYAYKALGSATDFSAYDAITAWVCAYSSAQILTNNWKLALCSDVAGAVIEYEYAIPASLTAGFSNYWYPIHVTGTAVGGNLTAIQSVALYSGSVAPSTTCGVQLDNISACSTTGLSLQTLISKSTQSTFDYAHPWWGIKSIVGTNIQLDASPGATSAAALGQGSGYSGITETVASFCRQTYQFLSGSAAANFRANSSGVTYSGGWNTSTTIKDGLTVTDHKDGIAGTSFAFSTNAFNMFTDFWIVRANRGLEIGGPGNRISSVGISNCNQTALSSTNLGSTYQTANFKADNCIMHSPPTLGLGIAGRDFVFKSCKFLSSTGASQINPLTANNVFVDCTFANLAVAGVFALAAPYTANYSFLNCTMDGYLALSANYGTLRLKNCLITSATEFSTGSSYHGWAFWSQQHDQTAFDYVFTEGATMNTEASDRAGATGNMWRMVLTSSIRSVAYPLRLPVAQFAVNASSLVTVTAWMKKSNATAVDGRLVIKAGQVAGLSTDQIATLANNTDWQQLTLTFTPTEAGVFEVETLAEYVTANGNVYIDEIEVTQA